MEEKVKREDTPTGIYAHPTTKNEVYAQDPLMAAALKDEGFELIETFAERREKERLDEIPEAEVVEETPKATKKSK